jgi:hypothetical protein
VVQFKLFLFTIGIWLSTILVLTVSIGIVAGVTADVSAAQMGLPVLCLGGITVFTVAADVFLLARLAQPVVDDGLRRLWIGAFVVLELGTAAAMMLITLVVLNR